MGNLLAKGQRLLTRLMTKDASPPGPVLYQRVAGGAPIDLTGVAWVGRTVYSRVPKEGGAAVVFGERDLLCPVRALPAEPERGDRVTETIDGAEVVFEVMELLGEPASRYADPGRTVWRIHLKEQKVA